MAEPHLTPRAILGELNKNGVTHVVWLPDSETNFMYEQMVADATLHLVPVCRETESIAIAAGLWVGGQEPVEVRVGADVLADREAGLGQGGPQRVVHPIPVGSEADVDRVEREVDRSGPLAGDPVHLLDRGIDVGDRGGLGALHAAV